MARHALQPANDDGDPAPPIIYRENVNALAISLDQAPQGYTNSTSARHESAYKIQMA
jgi:hypothetical protein